MKLEIFNNKIFRIPDYQRGYSWGESQLEDLWQDLKILEPNQNHYTGMLSVKFDKEKNIYHVIDGQQRITTFAILIKVISDRFKSNEWLNGREVSEYIKDFLYKKTGSQGEITVPIFGYEKDNPSHIYFKTAILGLENTDDSTPENTLYIKNLNTAKTFFEKQTKDLDKTELEKLLKKITENLKFNFYQIEDTLNEFVAFETMNNRGKPLSTLELLKNRLIYLSTLLPDNDDKEKSELREDINNAWKTIYEYLGKNPNAIIKDDDFLQNHCFIYFKFDKNINKKYKDFLLKKHFTASKVSSSAIEHKKILLETGLFKRKQEALNSIVITYSNIKDYVIDIQNSVKHYYFVHNVKDSECPYTDEEKTIISKIHRLGFQSFKPLVVALCCYDKYKKDRYALFHRIERCIFIMFHINFNRIVKQSTTFYHLANSIMKNKDEKIIMPITEEPIVKVIAATDIKCKPEKFSEKINDYEEGFYTWKVLKYFLYEYEIYLQEQHLGELKVEWEHVNHDTIEHIYPQNPEDESWKNAFENQQDLLHDLGNLLLLSGKINSSLKNKPFQDKKERFSTNSYSAIQVSKSENWTPDAILARREKMLAFMDERWDLKISDKVMSLLNKNAVE